MCIKNEQIKNLIYFTVFQIYILNEKNTITLYYHNI